MLGIACLLSHFLSANVQCFVDAGVALDFGPDLEHARLLGAVLDAL